MKIFLDTADPQIIKQWIPTNLIDGVTTNPSHVSKQGGDVKKTLLEICSMVKGDVSIEVVEKKPEAVYKQAIEISQLAKNAVVKIPFAKEYLPVIDRLVKEGIKLNITLVFSVIQALLVAKLGVKYISPFIGRLDDIGVHGMDLIEDAAHIIDEYKYKSFILAASIRSISHWKEAAECGADIVTLPPKILDQAMVHPLTDIGIAMFDADWKKLGKQNLLN